MRVLFVASKYDYGRRERGLSFEHHNFYSALVGMGLDVVEFDYTGVFDDLGRRGMNRKLWELVQQHQPDVLFGVIRNDLIDAKLMSRISALDTTTTINWFCDDHWQFDSQARRWAPHFNHVVTTSQSALDNYRKAGFTHVIKSQWACNTGDYRKLDVPMQYDVSFVGQCYGQRAAAVGALRAAGVEVACFGRGWPAGGVDQDEMIRIFNASRINLNFADASAGKRTWLDNLATGHVMQSLRHKPVAWRAWAWANRAAVWQHQRQNAQPGTTARQIKGRVFEVTGCGGFLLTPDAENLTDYLADGKHLAMYDGHDGLIDKVRYYLSHEAERAAVADAGYRRVQREHGYAHRFAEIFRQAGGGGYAAARRAA